MQPTTGYRAPILGMLFRKRNLESARYGDCSVIDQPSHLGRQVRFHAISYAAVPEDSHCCFQSWIVLARLGLVSLAGLRDRLAVSAADLLSLLGVQSRQREMITGHLTG